MRPDLAAGRVVDSSDAARVRDLAGAGKHRERRGQVERRHETGAERERRHVGQVVQSGAGGQADHVLRSDFLLQFGGRGIVRFEQRRPKRQLIRLLALAAAGGPFGIIRGRDVLQIRHHRDRGKAALQCRGVHERLERRTGLTTAARRPIERAALIVCAADHRENVAGRRIDGDQRRFQSGTAQSLEPGGDRALRRVLN